MAPDRRKHTTMKSGVVFPQLEIGTDPAVIRDFVQAVEGLGFDHLIIYDHVVGADISNRRDWAGPYTHKDVFFEPLTLIAYLASLTGSLEFCPGIVILPQRQTTLVAKQAACIDVLCNGRLRLGIGSGWNPVEYEALGVPFAGRGQRMDEQIELLRLLWTREVLSFAGDYHEVAEAGINPLPRQRPIPLWGGGTAKIALRRAASKCDGWIAPLLPAHTASQTVESFYGLVREAGRRREDVGLENLIALGTTMGGPVRGYEEAAEDFAAWKEAGATHVGLHTMEAGLKTVEAHIELLRAYREATGN